MSSSHFDGFARTPLRVGLAVVSSIVFMGEVLSVWVQVNDGYFLPRDALLLYVLPPSPVLMVGLALLLFGALVSFALGRQPLAAGCVALACLAPINQWGLEISGSVSHNFYYPASMMLGWCAGLLYARWLTRKGYDESVRGPDDRFAEAGAIGVIAALYVGSGLSKLLTNGLAWANPHGIRAVLLSQQGLVHSGWNDAYRAFVIEHPAVSMSMSVATLVIELGAFALLVNRPLRVLWCFLILGLHVNIMLLAHIPYVEPMLLVPLFALPWPWLFRMRRQEPASPPDVAAAELPFPRTFVVTALAVALLSQLLPTPIRGDGLPRGEEETSIHAPPPDHHVD